MYATTEAELTASGAAAILVDRYIPLRGCPATVQSDNCFEFCSKLSRALYERLGINKYATSSYHPCTNGGVERVNYTLALLLTTVGDVEQNYWDLQPPHVESAHNNSVSATTGLASNEVQICRLPRNPLPIFDLPKGWSTSKRQPRPASLHQPRHCPPTTRLPRRPGTRHLRIASRPPQRPHHGRPPPIPSVHHRWLGVDPQLRCHHPPRCQKTAPTPPFS